MSARPTNTCSEGDTVWTNWKSAMVELCYSSFAFLNSYIGRPLRARAAPHLALCHVFLSM